MGVTYRETLIQLLPKVARLDDRIWYDMCEEEGIFSHTDIVWGRDVVASDPVSSRKVSS